MEKKNTLDRAFSDFADIVQTDLRGFDDRAGEHLATRLATLKASGMVPQSATIKVLIGVTIQLSNPEVPGIDGTEERNGLPHSITV